MTRTVRILLLLAASGTTVWILYKIRKLKIRMQDAIFWIVFAAILFVMGFFPRVAYWFSSKLGFISAANFVYLVIIGLMMEKLFTLSIIVSHMEERIDVLAAELALRSHSSSKRLDKGEEHMEELRKGEEESENESYSDEEI